MNKPFKLLSLSAFVSWLNSMTTIELLVEFPGRFHRLNPADRESESNEKMLANQAILWDLTKEYNQFLLQPLKLEMFVHADNKKRIFRNFIIRDSLTDKGVSILVKSIGNSQSYFECKTSEFFDILKARQNINLRFPRLSDTIQDLANDQYCFESEIFILEKCPIRPF